MASDLTYTLPVVECVYEACSNVGAVESELSGTENLGPIEQLTSLEPIEYVLRDSGPQEILLPNIDVFCGTPINLFERAVLAYADGSIVRPTENSLQEFGI